MAGIITLLNNEDNDELFYQYDRGRIINIDISSFNDDTMAEEDRVVFARVECAPVINGVEMNAIVADIVTELEDGSLEDTENPEISEGMQDTISPETSIIPIDNLIQVEVPYTILFEPGQLNIYVLVKKLSQAEDVNAPTWVIDKKTYSIVERSAPHSLIELVNGVAPSNPVKNENILSTLTPDRKYSYRGMTSGLFPLTDQGEEEIWHENDICLDIENNHLYIYINISSQNDENSELSNGVSYKWLDIGNTWYGDRDGNLTFWTGYTWIKTPFIYSAEQAENKIQEIYSFEGTTFNIKSLNTIGADLFSNNPDEHIGDTYMVFAEGNSLFTWVRFENYEHDNHPQDDRIHIYQPETDQEIVYTWIQLNRSSGDITQELNNIIDKTNTYTGNLDVAIKNTASGRIPESLLINKIIKKINQQKLDIEIFNNFLNSNRIRVITYTDDNSIDSMIDDLRESGVYLFTKTIPNYIDKPLNGILLFVTVKEVLDPVTNEETGYVDETAIRRDIYQIIIRENNIISRYCWNRRYKKEEDQDYTVGGVGWTYKEFIIDNLLTKENVVDEIYNSDPNNTDILIPNLKAIYEALENKITYKGELLISELDKIIEEDNNQAGDLYHITDEEEQSKFFALFVASNIVEKILNYDSTYTKKYIDTELGKKQDKITVDDAPTFNSNNLLTSGAIYNALSEFVAEKEINKNSKKPVSGEAVYNAFYGFDGELISIFAKNIVSLNPQLYFCGKMPENMVEFFNSEDSDILVEKIREYKKDNSITKTEAFINHGLWCAVVEAKKENEETTSKNKYGIQSDSFVFYRCTSIDSLDTNGKITNTTEGIRMKALSVSDLIEKSHIIEKDSGSLITSDAVYNFVEQSKINHFHYRGEVATKEEINQPENSHAGDVWKILSSSEENFIPGYYMWNGNEPYISNLTLLFVLAQNNITTRLDNNGFSTPIASSTAYEIVQHFVNCLPSKKYKPVFKGHYLNDLNTLVNDSSASRQLGDVYWGEYNQKPGLYMITFNTQAGIVLESLETLFESDTITEYNDTNFNDINTISYCIMRYSSGAQAKGNNSPVEETSVLLFTSLYTQYVYSKGTLYFRVKKGNVWEDWHNCSFIEKMNSADDCVVNGIYKAKTSLNVGDTEQEFIILQNNNWQYIFNNGYIYKRQKSSEGWTQWISDKNNDYIQKISNANSIPSLTAGIYKGYTGAGPEVIESIIIQSDTNYQNVFKGSNVYTRSDISKPWQVYTYVYDFGNNIDDFTEPGIGYGIFQIPENQNQVRGTVQNVYMADGLIKQIFISGERIYVREYSNETLWTPWRNISNYLGGDVNLSTFFTPGVYTCDMCMSSPTSLLSNYTLNVQAMINEQTGKHEYNQTVLFGTKLWYRSIEADYMEIKNGTASFGPWILKTLA